MTIEGYKLSIVSIIMGVFLLILERQKIYNAIIMQRVANKSFIGHRSGSPRFIIGRQATVVGIILLLFYLSLIIIPIYFIIRDIFF